MVRKVIAAQPRQVWAGNLFTFSGGATYRGFPVELKIVHTYWLALAICLEARGWVRKRVSSVS